MSNWVEAGFSPDLFWEISFREYRASMRGAVNRLEREHNDRAWLAWHTAHLTVYAPEKSRNFQKLKTLQVGRPSAQKGKSWEDQFAAFSAWAASFKKG